MIRSHKISCSCQISQDLLFRLAQSLCHGRPHHYTSSIEHVCSPCNEYYCIPAKIPVCQYGINLACRKLGSLSPLTPSTPPSRSMDSCMLHWPNNPLQEPSLVLRSGSDWLCYWFVHVMSCLISMGDSPVSLAHCYDIIMTYVILHSPKICW